MSAILLFLLCIPFNSWGGQCSMPGVTKGNIVFEWPLSLWWSDGTFLSHIFTVLSYSGAVQLFAPRPASLAGDPEHWHGYVPLWLLSHENTDAMQRWHRHCTHSRLHCPSRGFTVSPKWLTCCYLLFADLKQQQDSFFCFFFPVWLVRMWNSLAAGANHNCILSVSNVSHVTKTRKTLMGSGHTAQPENQVYPRGRDCVKLKFRKVPYLTYIMQVSVCRANLFN